jgi:hypothetical protein
VAQANVKLTVDASQATRALKGVQQQSSGLQRAFGGLKTAILGVGVTALGRQAILTSANFEKLNVRLGLLTKASGTFAKSQEIAAEAQKLFGLSATEALEGITNITARLQPWALVLKTSEQHSSDLIQRRNWRERQRWRVQTLSGNWHRL